MKKMTTNTQSKTTSKPDKDTGKRLPVMGGGMMKRDVAMKKGGKIPPQLKKFVMAKKKKAKMKKKA